MTVEERKEAIKVLKNYDLNNSKVNSLLFSAEEIANAFDCALEALEQEPALDKIKAEIKEWYWQVDKQALAKDPCVIDAMIDLFVRTINKYKAESEK